MTTDQSFFGLVVAYYERGDLRALLDDRDTHISIEQKSRILMDVAQVNMNHSVELAYCPGNSHLRTSGIVRRECNTCTRTKPSIAT